MWVGTPRSLKAHLSLSADRRASPALHVAAAFLSSRNPSPTSYFSPGHSFALTSADPSLSLSTFALPDAAPRASLENASVAVLFISHFLQPLPVTYEPEPRLLECVSHPPWLQLSPRWLDLPSPCQPYAEPPETVLFPEHDAVACAPPALSDACSAIHCTANPSPSLQTHLQISPERPAKIHPPPRGWAPLADIPPSPPERYAHPLCLQP